jgi:hypothetical protein
MNEKTTAAILACLCLVLPRLGLTAERKSDLRITYTPPSISVEAQGVRLLEVLRNISLKVGFDLADYGVPDRNLTVSIQEAAVEDVLRQLLRGESYGVVHREKDGSVSKLLLLSSPDYEHQMYENQERAIEVNRTKEGLTIFPAAPSYQPARLEQPQNNRDENAPRVSEILQLHAISGRGELNTSLPSLTPNDPQSSRNLSPSLPPTQTASDGLAAATRLAQQNLKALADGLATATYSLRSSSGLK